MQPQFAVVDLFAGPGGLAEGFSSIRYRDGSRPFNVVLSVEKEASAFQTLRLRSFFRQFDGKPPQEYYQFIEGEIPEPDWEAQFPAQWQRACTETLRMELGAPAAAREIDERIGSIKRKFRGNTILIGGPPCQAYSLVGRARNRGTEGYVASKDHRHFLYREYIRILQELIPAAFVMENVKGLLSSSVDGDRIFDRVIEDLGRVGGGSYKLVPLAPRRTQPSLFEEVASPRALDFVVQSEDYGIPQSRHRVIIVGVRRDLATKLERPLATLSSLQRSPTQVSVRDVLRGMPKLRSGLSNRNDSEELWQSAASQIMRQVAKISPELHDDEEREFRDQAKRVSNSLAHSVKIYRRRGGAYAAVPSSCPEDLRDWLMDEKLRRFPNNETRSHMLADLGRYFYAALYGEIVGTSPKARDFPQELAPSHRNWKSGKFADRFRVQVWNLPATTVTSHISKDGHYFIHPDPNQCRSLTVREAARLQTFPDNYFFKGNRTEQFVQVGNAVPPFLARQIAASVLRLIDGTASGTLKKIA